jgi:hypothetical protein
MGENSKLNGLITLLIPGLDARISAPVVIIATLKRGHVAPGLSNGEITNVVGHQRQIGKNH